MDSFTGNTPGLEPVVPVVAVIQRTATVVAGVKEEEEG